MSVIRQRKNYFIKPGFQSRLTAIMILLVIIVANLVGGLTYLCSHEGLDKLLQEKTGINVMIAQDTVSCVALGTGKSLEHIELLNSGNATKIRNL